MRATRVALVLAALLIGACGEPQDEPTDVHDLRILAVAADPPEVLFDRNTGTFDHDTVTFRALVADPSGVVTTARWAFCPVESEQTCDDYQTFRDQAAPVLQPVLDQMRAQTLMVPGQTAPEQGWGAWSVAPFLTRVDPGVVAYHMANSALGLGNGAWMSASLTLTGGMQSLVGQKRVVVAARDLAQYNPELAATFGFRVCESAAPATAPAATAPPGATPSPVAGGDCLPLPPRAPNRNPNILRVMVAEESSGGAFVAAHEPTSPLVVAPGARLQILPELDDGGQETYAFVDTSLQDPRLQVVEKKEQPIVSWFATGGELSHERTSAVDTKTLANVFTAPKTVPAEGGVSVWMVVRDHRGGTGWRHVDVLVKP